MEKRRGTIYLYKHDFSDKEFALNVGCNGDDMPNFHTKAFRRFQNQYVGHPNMTIFSDKQARDDRYEKGKRLLEEAGYNVIEKGAKI